jgi:hypothetical protein
MLIQYSDLVAAGGVGNGHWLSSVEVIPDTIYVPRMLVFHCAAEINHHRNTA